MKCVIDRPFEISKIRIAEKNKLKYEIEFDVPPKKLFAKYKYQDPTMDELLNDYRKEEFIESKPIAMTSKELNKQISLHFNNVITNCTCPITYELFKDPVIDEYGHSYEKEEMLKIREKQKTSPMTGKSQRFLFENKTLKRFCSFFRSYLKSKPFDILDDYITIEEQFEQNFHKNLFHRDNYFINECFGVINSMSNLPPYYPVYFVCILREAMFWVFGMFKHAETLSLESLFPYAKSVDRTNKKKDSLKLLEMIQESNGERIYCIKNFCMQNIAWSMYNLEAYAKVKMNAHFSLLMKYVNDNKMFDMPQIYVEEIIKNVFLNGNASKGLFVFNQPYWTVGICCFLAFVLKENFNNIYYLLCISNKKCYELEGEPLTLYNKILDIVFFLFNIKLEDKEHANLKQMAKRIPRERYIDLIQYYYFHKHKRWSFMSSLDNHNVQNGFPKMREFPIIDYNLTCFFKEFMSLKYLWKEKSLCNLQMRWQYETHNNTRSIYDTGILTWVNSVYLCSNGFTISDLTYNEVYLNYNTNFEQKLDNYNGISSNINDMVFKMHVNEETIATHSFFTWINCIYPYKAPFRRDVYTLILYELLKRNFKEVREFVSKSQSDVFNRVDIDLRSNDITDSISQSSAENKHKKRRTFVIPETIEIN